MIRTYWVGLVAIVMMAFYAPIILMASPFRRACRCGHWARGWAATILRAAGVTVTSTGLERIDPDHSQIVVCNHQSWFDVLALFAAFPLSLRFVAKGELRSVPVFGRAIQQCGHIVIDRRNRRGAIESLRRAAQQLRERALHVVLFAEGTRSPTGELQPFKKGAFVLAIETRTPILPVSVTGSRAVMAKHGYRIRQGAIEVRVGEPIAVDDFEIADRNTLRDRTWRAVVELLEAGSASREAPPRAEPKPAPAGQAMAPR